MAKPLILARPSGAFVRLRIPNDLRACFGGRRFVVRRIYDQDQAEIRLAAAVLALVFSRVFAALRRGESVDWDKLIAGALAKAEGGKTKDYKLRMTEFGPEVETDGSPEDNQAAQKAISAYWDAQAGRGGNKGAKRVLFATAKDKWLGDYESGVETGEFADKTFTESALTLNILEGVLDEGLYLDQITDDHIREFYNKVKALPVRATQKREYRDLLPSNKPQLWQIDKVIARGKQLGHPTIGAHTQEKHRQRLAAFLNLQEAHKNIGVNPMSGIASNEKPTADETGRPFTDEELAAIFEPDRFWAWGKKHPHQFFGTMMGLYSGARVNEIGQLYVDDIEQFPTTGVWGFHVRHNPARGQRTKNKQSRRFIPIAQPILDAGLLTYIHDLKAAGHKRLFPELPNATGRGFGRTLSKHFAKYLRDQCGIDEPGSGFHYFRHALISTLYGEDKNPAVIGEISGHRSDHKAGPQAVMVKHYVKTTLPAVVALVEGYRPQVKLPQYVRGMFSRDLRSSPIDWEPQPRKRKKDMPTGGFPVG